MNPGLKIKSLYILVGVLLLVNVATLGFIWYTTIKVRTEQVIPPGPENEKSGLASELNFSKEQIQKFEVLKKEHHTGVENVLVQTKELKDQLFDCIKTGDDAKAKELATKIADNNKTLELLTYEHFKEVRKICNDEQKEKFDRILKQLVRGIELQNPPGNRPPPGDRPPRGDRPPPGEEPPPRR